MPEKFHIVVVCGYGCHLIDPKTGNDTPLKTYLDRVISFINKQDPDLVVFCGGYTQRKTAPGVSEAGLMLSYVNPYQRCLDEYNIICSGRKAEFVNDDDSYTTYENMMNASVVIFEKTLDKPLSKTIKQ